MTDPAAAPRVALAQVARDWTRIGATGFGGPPAHIALLRRLCVERRGWLTADELEDAIATANLLPGPASTQLAIYCAWRVAGVPGAVVGGLGFILPGLVAIIALAAAFLAHAPPDWLRGAGAGAGAAVAAVALQAGWALLPVAWSRVTGPRRLAFAAYGAAGALAAATAGPWVVLVLLACGVTELARRRAPGSPGVFATPLVASATTLGGSALVWTAFKVGALSYGGGFVIVPLMQSDAVHRHHWMTGGQFLNAVALGQVTPGPVVHTVAAVGYAAGGVGGALLAATVAFAPSFAFVLVGGRHLDRVRRNPSARAFLDGAGPAAIGAILGSSIPLARALGEPWQVAILGAAAVALLVLRRGVVATLVAAGVIGAALVSAGAALPR